MMQSKRHPWVVILAIILYMSHVGHTYAQSVDVLDVDDSAYPLIRAAFVAFDSQGARADVQAADITVREDGVPRSVVSVTCPAVTQRPISAVLALDVSRSMIGGLPGGGIRLDAANAAAQAWIDIQDLDHGECAITSFCGVGNLQQDFTNDRAALHQTLDKLYLCDYTDLNAALYDPPAGALQVSARGQYRKVVVLLTDGRSQSALRTAEIIGEARRQDCRIYAVMIGGQLTGDIREICQETGGTYYEGVTTKAEAVRMFRTILVHASDQSPCEVVWRTEPRCTSTPASVELRWHGVADTTSYEPGARQPTLRILPQSTYFQNVSAGSLADTTIDVTARNGSVTVLGITSSNPRFSVLPRQFVVPVGGRQTLTVVYEAQDSAYSWTEFTVSTSTCEYMFQASGGFGSRPVQDTKLEVVHPNGGERFVAGMDAVVSWKGIPRGDSVRIDLSTDAGATWKQLPGYGTGYTYDWRSVPRPPSDSCMVRVRQLIPIRDMQPALTLKGHTAGVNAVAWNGTGLRIATAGADGAVRIYDARYGPETYTYVAHTGSVRDVDFAPDAVTVASAGADGRARVWSSQTGMDQATMLGHTRAVNTVDFRFDGTQLLTCSDDMTARIWNVADGAIIRVLSGHTAAVRAATWSADGSLVATVSDDGTMKIWNATNGVLVRTQAGFTGTPRTVEWSSDGSRICVGTSGSIVYVYSSTTGSVLASLVGQRGATARVCWNTTGTRIATVGADSTARVWDAASGQLLRQFTGHRGPVNGAAWSAAGNRLATSGMDSVAYIWDVDTASLQEDVSDAVFSIVAPTAAGQDVDMRAVPVNGTRDSLVQEYIHNTGSYPLVVDSFTVSGANADEFDVLASGMPMLVPPGATLAVEFRFRPAAIGLRTAQIRIHAAGEVLAYTIHGNGLADVVEIQNTVIDFGRVELGTSRDTLRAFTIRNTGSQNLVVTATAYLPAVGSAFMTIAGGAPFTLLPGQAAEMNLRFTPSRVGRIGGTLQFTYNGGGTPVSISLFGEGFQRLPRLRVDVPEPNVVVCADEGMDTLLLENIGDADLVVSSATITGTNATNFVFADPVLPSTLVPHAVANLRVRFLPTAVGSYTATLEIASNSAVDGLRAIALRGVYEHTGYELSTSVLDMGIVEPGAGTTSTIGIRNIGSVFDTYVADVTGPFDVDTVSAAASASVSAIVRFAGSVTPGIHTGTLSFRDSICNVRHETSVTVTVARSSTDGAAILAAAMPLPALICSEMVTRDVTIRNTGNAELVVRRAEVGGIHGGDYMFDPPFAELHVPAGEMRSLSLRYTPAGTGMRTAVLTLHSNAPADSVVQVDLSARHELSRLVLTPVVLDAGTLCPGEAYSLNAHILNAGSLPNRVTAMAGVPTAEPSMLRLLPAQSGTLVVSGRGPLREGAFADTLFMTDSLCGVTYMFSVAGYVVSAGITATDVVLYGIVGGGAVQRELMLVNGGVADIVVTGATSIVPFTLAGEYFPLTVGAGDTVRLVVQYQATDTLTRRATISFATVACATAARAVITGRGVEGGGTLVAGSVSAYTGEPVDVPITVRDVQALRSLGVTRVRVTLAYDASLLEPLGSTPHGTITGGVRNIPLDLPVGDDAVLAVLTFRALLGSDSVTALDLMDAVAAENGVPLRAEDGTFHLLGICYANGARLVYGDGATSLAVIRPNPVTGASASVDVELLETGPTTLVLVNVLGERCREIFHAIPRRGHHRFVLDAAGLVPGPYFLVLQTPTMRQSVRVEVMK